MNKQSLMNCIRTAALAAVAAIPGFSACTYSVSVPAIGSGGGQVPVYVSTQPGCPWQLAHSGAFLSNYYNLSGYGSGVGYFYAQPDYGAARYGTVYVDRPASSNPVICGRSCGPTGPVRMATTSVVQY